MLSLFNPLGFNVNIVSAKENNSILIYFNNSFFKNVIVYLTHAHIYCSVFSGLLKYIVSIKTHCHWTLEMTVKEKSNGLNRIILSF